MFEQTRRHQKQPPGGYCLCFHLDATEAHRQPVLSQPSDGGVRTDEGSDEGVEVVSSE